MGSLNHPAALVRRPKLEVADIFKKYRNRLGPLPGVMAKVVRDIIDCRTAKLGGHIRKCDKAECGYEEISYNSCRNRHCPKCQFLARAKWVEARIDELLPVPYFHVVFTLPHALNPLILQNKKELYTVLFQAASETIQEVARRNLDAEFGFISVLHTWGQNLLEHPHIHMIVPGGGLRKNPDETYDWIPCKRGYLFPLQVLAKVFRGKVLSKLEKIAGSLKYEGRIQPLSDPKKFKRLLMDTCQKPWIVYTKPPFAGPEQVIHYLGNYTHRIAISNNRLIKIENDQVHFKYRDYAQKNRKKVMVLSAQEFMRRFLLHVLPRRFIRIRHHGFLANRSRKVKLEICKSILIPKPDVEVTSSINVDPKAPTEQILDWKERYRLLTGIDLKVCPNCKAGEMREVQVIESFYDRRRRGFYRKRMDSS